MKAVLEGLSLHTVRDLITKIQYPETTKVQTAAMAGSLTMEKLPVEWADHEEGPELLNQYLYYLFTEGQRLTAIAKDLIISEEEDGASYVSLSDKGGLSMYVDEIAKSVTSFTKDLSRYRPWVKAHGDAVPVMRVWVDAKTKDPIGAPTNRKIASGNIQYNDCAIGIIEVNGRETPAFWCNDGIKKKQENGDEVLEQFFFDLPKTYRALMRDKRGNFATVQGARAVSKTLEDSHNLLVAFDGLATLLGKLGRNGEVDHQEIYGLGNEPMTRGEVKAENNPNALLEIGGWS